MPLTLKLVTVCVVPAVNVKVVGWTLLEMVVNVLLLLIVKAPAPAFSSTCQVEPPPANLFALADVMRIVAVLAVTVAPTLTQASVPLPLTVMVPEPSVSTRVKATFDVNVPSEAF